MGVLTDSFTDLIVITVEYVVVVVLVGFIIGFMRMTDSWGRQK